MSGLESLFGAQARSPPTGVGIRYRVVTCRRSGRRTCRRGTGTPRDRQKSSGHSHEKCACAEHESPRMSYRFTARPIARQCSDYGMHTRQESPIFGVIFAHGGNTSTTSIRHYMDIYVQSGASLDGPMARRMAGMIHVGGGVSATPRERRAVCWSTKKHLVRGGAGATCEGLLLTQSAVLEGELVAVVPAARQDVEHAEPRHMLQE